MVFPPTPELSRACRARAWLSAVPRHCPVLTVGSGQATSRRHFDGMPCSQFQAHSGTGLFCYNAINRSFLAQPWTLLTSDPCAKDPFSVKPNKERQVLVNVRSHHRGQTINAFKSGETEVRGSESIGSFCRGQSCRGGRAIPLCGTQIWGQAFASRPSRSLGRLWAQVSSSPRDLQHLGSGRAACLPRKSHIRKVCDVFLTVYNAI